MVGKAGPAEILKEVAEKRYLVIDLEGGVVHMRRDTSLSMASCPVHRMGPMEQPRNFFAQREACATQMQHFVQRKREGSKWIFCNKQLARTRGRVRGILIVMCRDWIAALKRVAIST